MRKSALEKHSLMCSIIQNNNNNKNKNKSNKDDIEPPLPSQRHMFNMIQELVLRNQQLTEKVELLEKHVIKTKKKLNVVDWCNSHYANNRPLHEFIKNMAIPEKTIEHVFDECIYTVLQNWLSVCLKDKNKSPFLSFSNQPHELYIFTTVVTTGENPSTPTPANAWQKMEKSQLIYTMNMIQKKMLQLLNAWKKDNTSPDEDKVAILYSKAMSKILVSYQDNHVLSRVKNIIIDIVKIDVKQIIEYELDVA